MTLQKPREIAVRALQRRERAARFIEDYLEEELAGASLSSADRRLAQELTYGVVRWQAALDWLIAKKTGGRPQKSTLQILLRIGLYQIFWLDRVPNHAAVHETVELAKNLGLGRQGGFVNAILRSYIREQVETEATLETLKMTQPPVGFSHPAWLCERWMARWGREKAAQLLDWNNRPPNTYARVNTLRVEPGTLLAQWRDENVESDCFVRDWTGENLMFELKSHPPLASLPSFQQGFFYIQDPSTLLAVRELDPHPGESVLDLCAAPGGKTTFIAQCMENQGRIVAQDHDPKRRLLLQENCSRLGATSVETSRPPETHFPELAGQFDRVLVDAPCSNTGVLRRRVDLRWRIRPEEIERLRAAQLDLLHLAALQLPPGGLLVYSTCSLEQEENQGVREPFLDQHPEFELDRERELLPFADGVDGAYVARFKKISAAERRVE